jgi:AcrR family transcriptional regulator
MSAMEDTPTLTQRRKAATRLDIARAAVDLFTIKGVAATSAEEIAAAAGISLRTLWRYTTSKEASVIPLFNVGVQYFIQAIRDWPRAEGVSALIGRIEQERDALPDPAPFLTLVKLARTDPALRTAWLQAHDDAEGLYAAALAPRMGKPADHLAVRTQATIINNAMRVATEHYAWQGKPGSAEPIDGLMASIRAALHEAATEFS